MNSFFFSITSNDGKQFESEVEEVYFTSIKKGDRAILRGSEDLGCLIGISKLFYKKDGVIKYISTSGGIMSFHNNKAIFLVETFELEHELDKERVLNSKKKAEEVLKNSARSQSEIEDAEISLKKAINRLSILK